MVTVDIKSVQQMLQRKITFRLAKCLSKKKIRNVCDSWLLHKNEFFFKLTY